MQKSGEKVNQARESPPSQPPADLSFGGFSASKPGRHALPPGLLDTELGFYGSYPWCINPFPTLREVSQHLLREFTRFDEVHEGWQRAEILTNVFLLSCGISDVVDDYLAGDGYDFSKAALVLPGVGFAVRAVEKLQAAGRRLRALRLSPLYRWRREWKVGLDEFLKFFVVGGYPRDVANCRSRLAALLASGLPADLQAERLKSPAAFRSYDLTHFDILNLGRKFVAAFPDVARPVLVLGLRTAGSYFAPVLRAYLQAEGYQDSDDLTVRPTKGITGWERAQLKHWAKKGALALVVDEPPGTGSAFAKAVTLCHNVGFPATNVVVLAPLHPAARNWKSNDHARPLSKTCVLSLEPEEWHKSQLLEPQAAESLLKEYFQGRQYLSADVVLGERPEQLNCQLQSLSEEQFHTRLKRAYEVRLKNSSGEYETRYVLAKSVGWGWLGYHAFIAGDRLSPFVPTVLGLRNGILYSECYPQNGTFAPADRDRDELIGVAASYVAARVRSLGLEKDPSADLTREKRQRGVEELASVLSRAYAPKLAALKRGRIRYEVSRHACPFPTLIDGRMRRVEWIRGPSSFLKTDFEHHGLGKKELNVTDPAFDLAEAILHFRLAPTEEHRLIDRYIEQCGDVHLVQRLFLNKLLAGRWARDVALNVLNDSRLSARHQEFNQQYLDSNNFLTVHTMRFCASLSRRPENVYWHAPLVVMDIDGVLDRQVFGFPSTTTAGIQAISLLHAHQFAIALGTARALSEVKDYCKAYGFVGAVAEYGSCIWDAVGRRERILVNPESLSQLEKVGNALREIPGVFLNDGYQYSIRAYTYEGNRTVPLPMLLIRNLMASLKVDQLRFHQTGTDTAVLAKEIDKGSGLVALLDWVGQRDVETLAIGDSEPDLPVFSVARRCFAPAQISCREIAKSLGCQIADRAYQPGLLSIVRSLVHPDGRKCERCRAGDWSRIGAKGLLPELLAVADQKFRSQFPRVLLDPMVLQAFEK